MKIKIVLFVFCLYKENTGVCGLLINTKHFGEIEVIEDRCITFEKGLPGFEDRHSFVIIEGDKPDSLFKWMQCVDDPNLAFVILNPFDIKPDYSFEIKDDILNELDISHQRDVAIYTIVNVPSDPSKVSMNLKAPVVINVKNRRGMQIILDTDKYNVRHYILDEIRKQGVSHNVGADTEKGAVACY